MHAMNELKDDKEEEQVTRGHNIVADGWAGASNPQPHPTPIPNTPRTHSMTSLPKLTLSLSDETLHQLFIRMGSIWAFEIKIISKHFSCSICIIRPQPTRKIDLDLI